MSRKKKKQDQGMAIVALILNVLIIPGLGSVIAGKTKEGIWQLVLFLGGLTIGIILSLTIIGIFLGLPLMILAPLAAWIWGLVTGIQLVQETSD